MNKDIELQSSYDEGYRAGFDDGADSRAHEIKDLQEKIEELYKEIKDLEKHLELVQQDHNDLQEENNQNSILLERYQWLRSGNIGLLAYTETGDGLEFPSFQELDRQIDGIKSLLP